MKDNKIDLLHLERRFDDNYLSWLCGKDNLEQLFMLGILAAFVILVSGTIFFALWDRRTMIRLLKQKLKR